MTTVPPRPTSSPRWDSRNEGFVSPARLQQWKQENERTHTFSSPPSQAQQDSGPQQVANADRPVQGRRITDTYPNPPSTATPNKAQHRSKPSFSAFFSRKSSQPDDALPLSPPARPTVQQSASEANVPQGHQSQPSGPQRAPSRDESSAVTSPRVLQKEPPLARSQTAQTAPAQVPPLHPEIRSIVTLTLAHAHKIYFSGPLIRRIERQTDGHAPAKDEGWREVWAQLGGTTLSVWDMEEIREASKQGKQVPPSYINVTDAFVQQVGSFTVPSPSPGVPPRRYPNVLSLNTAGSNLYLFSCPSEAALVQWIAAFRLSAWEKSRLEEIYTAHLIRITLNDGRTTPSPLMNGRLEGWVRIRIAGQTDWKRQWMVITTGNHPGHPDHGSISSMAQERSESPSAPRKKRMSNLFSRDKSPTRTQLPVQPMIQLFATSRPRDKKKALLTMHSVTQAFAVYPERPELISRSTLMKLEGRLGNEEMAGSLSMCEAWLLVMPELEGQNTRASEMLRWIIAIHDAFELYGRPRMYSWDPRDPKSMMFAYPIGPNRDLLFLDREFADTLPINEKSTSAVRSQLQRILLDRMNGVGPEAPQGPADNGPPTLPPLPNVTADEPEQPVPRQPALNGGGSLQLPPLSFDSTPIHEDRAPQTADADHRPLTPITERSVPLEAASRSMSGEKPPEAKAQLSNSPPQATIPEEQPSTSILNQPFVTSPSATSPPPEYVSPRRSEDSFGPGTSSRPDSKLSYRAGQIASVPSRSSNSHPASPPLGERVQPPTSPEIRPSTPSTPPRFQSPRALSPPRLASPPQPQLQTPVSPAPETPNSVRIVPPRSMSQSSIPTSLYTLPTPTSRTGQSMMEHAKDKPAPPLPISAASSQSPPAVPRKNSTEADDILGDAGAALFYMQHMQQQEGGGAPGPRSRPIRLRGPPPKASPSEDEDETPSESDSEPYTPPPRAMTSPLHVHQTSPPPGEQAPPVVPAKSPRPSADQAVSTPSEAPTAMAAASRPSALRNKPSGARAAPSSSSTRMSAYLQNSLPPPDEAPSEKTTTTTANTTDKSDDDRDAMAAAVQNPAPAHDHGFEDPTADALAALSFLEREERPAPPPAAPQSPSQRSFTATPRSPPLPEVVETPASPSQTRPAPSEPRSSFAPTRLAAERKAKSQAQQAAHQAAAHRPGKANGRKGKPRDSGAWGESSDEEEEEEEEEDDDVDSDDEPAPRTRTTSVSDQASALGHGAPPSIAGRSPYAQTSTGSPARSQVDVNNNPGAYPAQRRGRDLPQVPGQRLPEQEDYLGAQPQPRRFVSDSFTDGGRRSMYPESLSRQASPSFGQSSMRPASQYPSASQVGPGLQPPSRPIWSQVLDPDRNVDPSANNGRDTFIQIEAPATTMTKAFTPHGLLSAGLQDKQDRSAKRQEELARETGASLINVPNKPPPPQTGLLGAVTAHERERKREGGLGAALTEREREKRMAEERQRKLDEFQRQQLDQMQQGGSMYGGMGMGPMGFNPMMANPMMMGMNPMMTGGWGFPGMMPGFANPQQMFAAQQAAAQAYQQAMVAFSTAGSQIGGGAGGGADGGANQGALNPMMTGASMGMAGFDPRMSMMGMPMMNTGMSGMGMGMGMGGGMNPGMGGMNPGMGGMNPNMGMGGMGGMGGMQGMGGMGLNPMMTGGGMGMQMTGGSQFDPRFSPGAEGAPRQPGDSTALGPRASSHPNSPGPQGSPAGPRPADSAESSQHNASGPSSNAQ